MRGEKVRKWERRTRKKMLVYVRDSDFVFRYVDKNRERERERERK